MKSIQIPIILTGLQPLDFPHKLGICERLFGKAIAQHGIAWVQTAAGITWKLDLALMTHRWIVYGKYEGAPFLIQVVRLADELESRGIEKIDLWKLDVEGYEIPAMQGVEKWIEEKKIKAIYAELIDEDDRNRSIRDYLAQFGYHCYLFNPRGKLFDPLQVQDFKFPRWTNGLFLPVKSLEEAQAV